MPGRRWVKPAANARDRGFSGEIRHPRESAESLQARTAPVEPTSSRPISRLMKSRPTFRPPSKPEQASTQLQHGAVRRGSAVRTSLEIDEVKVVLQLDQARHSV